MKNIPKAVIYYFSGTGNARQIALWFQDSATKMGTECDIFDIAKCGKGPMVSVKNDTLILVISPVHGFNYPKITLDFIRKFPRGTNRVVLMNTRAAMKLGAVVTPGLTGIAFLVASLFLMIKGYKIVGQVPFDMPSNWLSIHPSLNEKTVKYIHKVNHGRAQKHASKIFSGKRDFLACRDLIQDILLAPIALGYYIIGRFALAKSFYVTAECNSCGTCSNQCPVHAISKKINRPYWTFRCENCMKCMNNCPQRAVESEHGLMATASITCSMAFTFLLDSVLHFEIKSLWVKVTIWSVIFIAIIWLMYRIQHLVLRYRFFSRIIALASLTHYKFWGRYKSIPDKEWMG